MFSVSKIRIPGFIKAGLFTFLLIFCLSSNSVYAKNYPYQSFKEDPLKARIYTLDNGLKVYMTVYKDEPRIQTSIAVNAGSKNDPADATGLAHYFEHLMFKGTDKFGTIDFEKEKEAYDRIIELYNQRYVETDSLRREELYRQIDSTSYAASQYVIAGEYKKMRSAIGAKAGNAYTSDEQTVYICDIPANQIETWALIEAERFRNPIPRMFHTVLEVVYEEKNRALDSDQRKMMAALNESLYQKHPYGTQTTLGSVEHLKNPSLQKVIDFFNTYYVPNNMAVCLSGDFDPDQVIAIIDATFGKLKPTEVPAFNPPVEDPITQPIVREVWGPEAEQVILGFRFGGIHTPDADMLTIIDQILQNRVAGLIDLNLNLGQKLLNGYSRTWSGKDYSDHSLGGKPREGQSLDEVKDLLLSQIELIKKGEFPDWLIPAIINDMKINQINNYESNYGRADAFVDAFIMGIPWDEYSRNIEHLSKISEQDIIDFANKNYHDNYCIVYKRQGEDKNKVRMAKPVITPVQLNLEAESKFTSDILARTVPKLSPVFLDYDKDISHFSTKNDLPVHMVENTENERFSIDFLWEMGTNHDRRIGIALSYLQYLGTSKLTPVEVKQKFYQMGCSFDVYHSEDNIYVWLTGLQENFKPGMELFEELLADAQPNPEALNNLVNDILKIRADNKKSKSSINRALYNYGMYGKKSPFTNILSEAELKALSPQELADIIHQLTTYPHQVFYYGPTKEKVLKSDLEKLHRIPKEFKALPVSAEFPQLPSLKNTIYVVDYEMEQVEITNLSRVEPFNKDIVAVRRLFDPYYDTCAFENLREARGLAYAVDFNFTDVSRKDKYHYISTYIGTQADKMLDAITATNDILKNMPVTEPTLIAKREALVNNIESERFTKSDKIFNYYRAKRLGLDYDIRRDIYKTVPKLTMADMQAFHDKYYKDRRYTTLILGDFDKLNMDQLKDFGEVNVLTLEDIFGY